MNHGLKLTEEVAADIRARVKSLDFTAIEKVRKAKEEHGSFDVIISTEVTDRAGEIVRQDGWDLKNYKNNPIVLWGHDYYSLPIGVCTETYNTTYRGVPALGARGVFYPAEINPLAQQVRRMYEYGVKSGYNVGCTTSVGFIPKDFDKDDARIITSAELLEFSFVPVPANQGVGPAAGRSLTFDEARELGLDVVSMRQKGLSFADTVGIIPKSGDDTKAAIETAWTAPTLKDFTASAWSDLSDTEKRDIAGHFAYAPEAVPAAFEDLKLPYRRAADNLIVWSGVRASMAALVEAVEIPGDRKAVYDHLAEQYKLFGKEAPEFASLKAAEAGDSCTMDDGTPGTLASDSNDPDGPLVCVPSQDGKSADTGHVSQKALIKALGDEHERHIGDVDKCFDDFRTAAAGIGSEQSSANMEKMLLSVKDLRLALQDEHTMHRAKSIACFRAFDPSENKAFDKNPHLKALRDTHDSYERMNGKALDEFAEKCMKTMQGEAGEVDQHTDWVTDTIEGNQRAHKKAVVKAAKAMCKDAFLEEDQADEKTLAILKEFLAPHIDPMLLTALTAKIGSKLSAATKAKLGEAHQHLKAAKAVLEDLHGGLADGGGEEGRSDEDDKSAPAMAPAKPRSRSRTPSHADPALQAHLEGREILRGIEAVAREGLGKFNAEIRSHGKR